MSRALWRQHLFSKRVDGGFETLTGRKEQGDYDLAMRVESRANSRRHKHVAFMLDDGNRVYVGVYGFVRDALNDKRFAYERTTAQSSEKGRPIRFIHGYIAKRGTSIPDLEELLDQQPKHLQEILERANVGKELAVNIADAEFTRLRSGESEWNQWSDEIAQGRHRGSGVLFSIPDGKCVDFINPVSITKKHGDEQLPPQKKTMGEPAEINRTEFLKIIAVGLGSVLTLFGLWKLAEKLKKQGDKKHPDEQSR